MLRTLALRLALGDVGCNIARYVVCIIFSACDVIAYARNIVLVLPVTVRRYTYLIVMF